MKRSKIKLAIKILAVVIICLISFVGIYVQEYNSMSNVVKDYQLGQDLNGYRQLVLEVVEDEEEETDEEETEDTTDEETDEEETESEEEEAEEETTEEESEEEDTVKIYETAKSVIENRLKAMNDLSVYEELKDIDTGEYNISLDKQTGKIYLQIPETTSTDFIVSNIIEVSDFEIADSEDGTVYLDNDDLKEARAVYNTTDDGTIVYLELEFTKEGAEILEDLSSNEYKTLEDDEDEEEEETDEEETEDDTEEETTDEEEEEEETQKEITLSISGSEIITTSFDTVMDEGIIDISMNSASTDTDEINEYLQSVNTIALLLNSGALPVEYEVTENQYVYSDISMESIQIALIIIAVAFVVLLIIMIIKKKVRGLLSAISFVGFAALYLLLIRYTNITITLETIVGGVLVLLINYIFSWQVLNLPLDNKKIYNREYLQKLITLIPVFAISIVFTLTDWTILNTFGMMMFWGILLMAIYNILVTKNIVD